MMYKGKYRMSASTKKRKKKPAILIISLVLLFAAVIGGTVAYLMDSTDPVENTFTPGDIKITIVEKTTENTKSDITLTNPETNNAVPVYIRATLAVYWTDIINGEEQVIAPPADCSVTGGDPLNEWFKVGDIYYYPDVVNPGVTTPELATDLVVSIPSGSTVKCYIDVRAEAIQAEPESVVSQVWTDITVVDGRLRAE